MGNDNIDVGNRSPTRKSGRIGVTGNRGPAELKIEKPTAQKVERPRICRAMLQQCADSGNFSAPQKFVRLVGCRDSKLWPPPWVRPRPSQAE